MSVKVRKFRRGGWEVDVHVTLPSGQRIRERRKVHVASKSAAKRWGEERQNFLAANGNEKKEEVPTLEAFSPRYIEQHAKANRQKHSTVIQKERIIENHLKPRMGKKRLSDISDGDVQKLKSDLLARSGKTVNNVLTVLNTMLKAAVRWRVIDRMPATIEQVKIDRVTEAKFYEPHDYERLVAAAQAIDSRIYLFVLLGGDAGLRCGEIIALEQSDVDLKRGLLTVRRSEWEGHVSSPRAAAKERCV